MNRFKSRIAAAGLLATSLAVFSSPAMAAHELAPGDTLSPFAGAGSGIYALSPTTDPMGLLADTGDQMLSTSLEGTTLNVILRAAVYAGPTGFLDFLYQVTNLDTSNTSAKNLSFANFAGFDVSSPGTGAWQQLAPFGVFTRTGVEQADSANRSPDGSVIGVSFQSNSFTDIDAGATQFVDPGETSSIFQFRVAATNFRGGTFGVLDGVSVTGRGFAPAAAVPEPATWAMMLLGFGILGFAMRRRSNVRTRVNFAMG